MIRKIVVLILGICIVLGAVSCSEEEIPIPPSSEDSSVTVEQEDRFCVTPFLEQGKIRMMLNEEYPTITDWKVLYEFHSYATEDDLDTWQDVQEHDCIAVLSTNQATLFDRVLVSVNGRFKLVQTEAGVYTPLLAEEDPLEKPRITTQHGKEQDWQMGNLEDAELVWKQGESVCGFWYPEASEAIFFTNTAPSPIRVKGITEKPNVCYSSWVPHSHSVKMKDGYLLTFDRNGEEQQDGEVDVAIYHNKKLTFLEEIEGVFPDSELLSETVISVGTTTRVCLYDVSSENPQTPIKIFGGNGNGLADSDVFIISPVLNDLEEENRHCIMYYITDEKEWRFCTFETDGTVIDDISTGLEVVNSTITNVKFKNGLVYFSYYPLGPLQPSVNYSVDVRPDKNHTPRRLD